MSTKREKTLKIDATEKDVQDLLDAMDAAGISTTSLREKFKKDSEKQYKDYTGCYCSMCSIPEHIPSDVTELKYKTIAGNSGKVIKELENARIVVTCLIIGMYVDSNIHDDALCLGRVLDVAPGKSSSRSLAKNCVILFHPAQIDYIHGKEYADIISKLAVLRSL